MNTKILTALLASAIVLVPLVTAPSPLVPDIYIGVPPDDAVLDLAIDDLRFSHGVWASAAPSADLGSVELHWYYNPGADQVKQDVKAEKDQVIGVSGRVTSVAAGLNGELMVAEKLRNGLTRVERYVVQAPLPVITSEGITLKPRAPLSRETVFESSLVGQDMVKYMVRDRAVPGGYLVQFYDSRDVGILLTDSLPGTIIPIKSGSGEPLLGKDFSMYLAGDHSTAGYVYAMVEMKFGFLETSNYYFIDSDRNGVFDFMGHLDASALDALNLGGLGNWIEQQGTPVSEML